MFKIKKKNPRKFVEIQPPALKPNLMLTLFLEFLKGKKERKGIKKKFLFFSFLSFVICSLSFTQSPLFAQVPQIPHLINFQSVLTDAAGVPLPNGVRSAHFRILDSAGAELYQETQNVESVQGVISAMVGSQGELNPELLIPRPPAFWGCRSMAAVRKPSWKLSRSLMR